MRTIIIGDIHGCAHAFSELLERMAPDAEHDRLILLGDLFDRGPDSWAVWQQAMALQQAFGERFVLLCGNHEEYWLQKRLSLMEKWAHNRVGRRATVQSFRKHKASVGESVPWLAEHVIDFWQDAEIQCVHAGIKVEPLQANDRYTLIHDHSVVWQNRYAGRLTVTGHLALEKACLFHGDGETVIRLEEGIFYPLPVQGVLCIDTGCGKGGRLTGMVVENSGFVLESVPEKELG